MTGPFIRCESLTKKYTGRNLTVTALSDINLDIQKGELVLVKGRSGAGKSTLLNLIGGLIRPTSGKVRIGDQAISELDNSSLSRILANRIGIIFQSLNLLPTYDIFENIEIALTPKGLGKKEIEKLAMPWFDQFDLAGKIHSHPEELSVGQQQKVAVIRTLVKDPSVILADEPTASVDEETAKEIIGCLTGLSKEKSVTVMIATHGIVSEGYADSVITLEDGCLKS